MAKVNETATNEVTISGHIKTVVANPSGLGLLGLGICTLVASSNKLGWSGADPINVIPWALFLGGLAQLIAGLFDFKHDNTFGATAFCGYGLFWFGVGATWMMKYGVWHLNGVGTADAKQLGFAFLGYFIFTMLMTLGAMGANKVLFLIFFFIDLLFLGLFMNTLGWGGEAWHELAGWSEFAVAMLSFYGAGANVLNSHYGKVVLPIGAPFGPWIKK